MNVLETERMILRHLTEGDVSNLLQILSDPEAMRFYERTKGKEDAAEWIDRNIKRYATLGHGFFACILKATQEFVGICGPILQENVDGHDEIEVGYLFVRKFWGQGLATEAARACLAYAFQNFSYPSLVSLIDPENWASRRVAEKNGLSFKKEVTFNKRRNCLYKITAQEFNP